MVWRASLMRWDVAHGARGCPQMRTVLFLERGFYERYDQEVDTGPMR